MEKRGRTARKLVGVGVMFGAFLALSAALAPSPAEALCMMRMPSGYWEGQQALRRGDHAEALRLFRQAQKFPGQARAWFAGAATSLGWQARAKGELDRALSLYRAALRESPTYVPAAAAAVAALEQAGRPHDALLEIRQLPKALKKNPSIWRLEVGVLKKIGDHAAAQRLQDRIDGKAERGERTEK